MEKTLNKPGVATLHQLANFGPSDIKQVTEALDAIPDKIERDDWVGGAKNQLAFRNEKNAKV